MRHRDWLHRKAIREDSPISWEMYKTVRNKVSSALRKAKTSLLNLSLCTGSVPSCWKAANVTPVFKKGDKLNPSNYRPISMIPALGKILERVVYTRLMYHLSENNIPVGFQTQPLHRRCLASYCRGPETRSRSGKGRCCCLH